MNEITELVTAMQQSPIVNAGIVFLSTSFIFILGLCVGSFLNVCTWRLPRGESIVNPGSHCPKCDHELQAWELIPLLSWLFLRARCSSCGQKISVRYPAVELLTGVVLTAVWLKIVFAAWPLGTAPAYLFLAAALIAVAIIDLEHMIIPNEITFTGTTLALLLALLIPSSHFAGAFLTPATFHDPLLLGWIYQVLHSWFPVFMEFPRAVSLLDAVSGLLLGGGVLLLMLESGKIFWGRRRYHAKIAREMKIDGNGVTVPNLYEATWDDMFFRDRDCFIADAESIEIIPKSRGKGAGKKGKTASLAENTGGKIIVAKTGIQVAKKHYEWREIKRIQAKVRSWQVPREVMGYGDVKMMGMTGAFLGPDAILFIIMIAAVLGTVVGTGFLLTGLQKRHVPLPFGPFISAAALFWILAGDTFLHWYSTLLTNFPR